jgi:hypothetical protein
MATCEVKIEIDASRVDGLVELLAAVQVLARDSERATLPASVRLAVDGVLEAAGKISAEFQATTLVDGKRSKTKPLGSLTTRRSK